LVIKDQGGTMSDDQEASKQGGARTSGLLIGFLSAVVLFTGADLAWRHFGQAPPAARIPSNISAPSETAAPREPETESASTTEASASTTEAGETELKPADGTRAENAADRAMAAANALRRGDDAAAASVAEQVLASSRMHAFGFAPFNRFVNHLSQGDDPEYLAGLNRWLKRDPHSALGYLMRAKYAYDTAWVVRGPDADWKVTDVHMQAFKEGLASAASDVQQSIGLGPNNPWSYFLWLGVASADGDTQRMDDVFNQGIARFPDYYELYRLRLLYINGQRARRDFVIKYAGAAPESSPLKLLSLQLLTDRPQTLDNGCLTLDIATLVSCVHDSIAPPADDPKAGVAQAFALYKHLDAVEYTNAVWPVLDAMQGHSYASSMLQQAAEAMGSDNALIHEPGHNNYALDDIIARVWEHLDNPVNVEQKYHEALADAQRMHFASEEDRQEALATIYDHMAWTARRASQYPQVIAFHDSANAAAGINHGGSQYLKCFALYKLSRFQEAVDECSDLIATHRDVVEALYNRARAYEGLKQYDAAIADFAPIAENGSENYIRWGAALEMEHVMALQKNYQGELDVFRKYPFMFDDRLQPPEDLAIAYNNRCFAYMKTGELEKALDDCNTSLTYGQLPDALRKQAELQKLLHKS
jgi:tetratricopeptide (TPR) repeat protein